MIRHIATTLVAASLAFTPLSAPQAQAADAEDIIGLAVILGATALILDRANDNDKKRARSSRAATSRTLERQIHDRKRSRYYDDDYRYNPGRGHAHGHRKHKKRGRKILPAGCIRYFETRRGMIRAFGERCLEANMRRADRLPSRCERTVRTRRGSRDIYLPRCLRREGWTVEARYRGN